MKKEILTNIFIVLFIVIYLIAMYIIEPFIGENIKILSLIAGIVSIIIFIIAKYKTKDKETIKKQIVLLIIGLGVILRGMYIVYTPVTERQHDVYSIEDEGHLGYIYTIFETGKLPKTNDIQFYHPPLHHFISAQWLKIGDLLNIDLERNLEGIQVLTAIYSSLIVLVLCSIMKHIKIKDIYKIIIIAITAFHPTFIIFAGLINNDILMTLLSFLIILYLLKWYEKTNIKNTIILALSTGLCVMTKVSGAVIAVPILYVFIRKILEIYKTEKKDVFKFLGYIFIFGIVSLPIGLWHPIRNYIMFDQPLGGVLIPGSSLYIGDFSIFQRFIIPSLEETFTQIYCVIPGHHNVIATLIKTSIFGEFTYNYLSKAFVDFFKVMNIIIILFTLIATFIEVIKLKKLKEKPLLIHVCLIFYFVLIASYIYFNINYPYSCTMNFRYIIPAVFIGALLLFDIVNDFKKESIETVVVLISIIFCNLSIGMFFLI